MKSLITHVNYDGWAYLKVLRAAAELGPEKFGSAVGGSFPSLHQTFVHLLWGEKLWLERWKGNSVAMTLDVRSYPTAESLVEGFEEINRRQLDYLRDLPSVASEQLISYVNFQGQTWRYPLRDMVQHLVVHSAYHRGQATTQIRLLGAVPPWTDFLVYVDTLRQPGSVGQSGWIRTLAPGD